MWLHRYAKFVSAATVLLIVAGGLVTSTGSGLAVPDWPTSYGWNMFTFPMKHMVGGIFYEHGHRLIASGVGLLTIILALWIWKAEPRRWMRVLGFTALGRRVPAGAARRHHRALFPSDGGVDGARRPRADLFLPDDRHRAVYLARMGDPAGSGRRPQLRWSRPRRRRHLSARSRRRNDAAFGRGAGDSGFPAGVRRVAAAAVDAQIAIHYAHRLGALVVTLAIAATAGHVWYHHPNGRNSGGPPILLCMPRARSGDAWRIRDLVEKNVAINTAHVVVGALTLATSSC